MQQRASLNSLTLIVTSFLITGCSTHIKGYSGETLAKTDVADVRVIAVGDKPTGVDLVNPATNTPIGNGKIVNHYGRTPWLRVPEDRHCLMVQSWPVQRPSLLDALNIHNPGCTRIGLALEKEICFETKAGNIYEIRVASATDIQLCNGDVFYRVVETETSKTIEEYGVSEICDPSGEP